MKIKILILIALICSNINSQNVGTYAFINSTITVTYPSTSTYITINGGGGSMDNGYSLPITIPFTFNFGGTDFTQYVMCSNGFIAFGTSLTSTEYGPFYNPWTGTRNNVICFMARDLFPDASSFFGYTTDGTAPNRVHKIFCLGIRPPGILQRGNCQIYLYEGTNKIEIIYNAFPLIWTGGCLVGLRGGSTGSADLRTLLGPGSTAWTNPIAGNSNNAGMNQNSVNADEGRMYTFFFDPTPMYYVSSNVTQTITSSVYSGATNQQIVGIEVVMGGYTNILNLNSLTLNTNGSTNAPGDIATAKIYSTGLTGTFSTSTLFGSAYNSPNGSFVINGSRVLENGTNFFWLVYDISSGAAGGNVVDAECNQLTISGSGGTQTPVIQAPAGSRQIIPALTSVNVGTGETYTSLTNSGGLFEAINTGAFPIAANITVNVTSNLNETGTVALNDWQNSYSLNIAPSAGVERLISGSNSSTALLTLSGADNVNIDGRFGGTGKYLRFRNTSGTKPTIQFMNDSRRNTVRDCYIESNNTQLSAGLGTILFSTTTGTNGNDSNTIMNCDIRNRSDAAGNPVYGIVCSGNSSGTTQQNSDNVITGCNIYNYNSASNTYGIYLLTGTGSNWRIENNSFYNTSPIAATLWHAVYINNISSGDNSVQNNYIGGTLPNCGGSALSGTMRTLYGVYLRLNSTSVNNNISGNTIKNINVTKNSNNTTTNVYDGIIGFHSSKCSININNNVMGDTVSNDNINITASSSFTSAGVIFIIADSVYSGNVNNNIVGSVTVSHPLASSTNNGNGFYGLFYFQGANVSTTTNISGNKFGSFTVPNSIKAVSAAGTQIYGIQFGFGNGFSPAVLNCKNNILVNMTNMPPHSQSNYTDGFKAITIIGSYVNNAVYNIENNYLYNLSSPWVYGMQCNLYDNSSGGSAVGYLNVKNNTVDGLTNNNSGSSISSHTAGIIVQGYSDFVMFPVIKLKSCKYRNRTFQ
jgi:hypothetical protein